MTETPLISIVVPIYKVEEYICKCVDSLRKQTYENIEIILVDDGSPDGCPAICDRYAAKDERIKVIHQNNRGLSAARNAGIEAASGTYIGFVDGDDWVEKEMYQSLLQAAIENNAQIVTCQFRYIFSNKKSKTDSVQEFVVNSEQAVRMLLEGSKLQDYVCNKLFLAELFYNIRFPVGQKFEDISTTYRLCMKAQCVVNLSGAYYCYLQRSSGIVHSGTLENEIDCYCAKKERHKELIQSFPESAADMMNGIGQSIVNIWGVAHKSRPNKQVQCRVTLADIAAFTKSHYAQLKCCTQLGITGRLTLSLARYARNWAFWLSAILRWLYDLKMCKIRQLEK